MGYYCYVCNLNYRTHAALSNHKIDSPYHHYCANCDTEFHNHTGLVQHYVQSPRHHYCQRCDAHFSFNSDLLEHYTSQHVYCLDCNQFFVNQYGLEQHRIQSPNHHYCAPCKRDFDSASNLKAHLASSTHQPKNVKCPFSGCGQAFVSQGALILHLEGGKCPSRVDRHRVNDFVSQLDTQNAITNPSRLIGYDSSSGSVTLSATSSSWNGHAFECYLCHKEFRLLQHLNSHLASPRHQDKIYVCPLSTCRQDFVTLSGLWQHVESEKCGVARFTVVKNTMEGIMNGMRRLTY